MNRRTVLTLAVFLLLPSACPAAGKPKGQDLSGWTGKWAIAWTRPGSWQPKQFTGTLTLEPSGGTVVPSLTFFETSGLFSVAAVDAREDTLRLAFSLENDATFRVDLFRDGDTVHGSAQWLKAPGEVQIPWSPVEGRRRSETSGPLLAPSIVTPWTVATPEQVGLDDAAVRSLVAAVNDLGFSGFILVKDDKLVAATGTAPDDSAQVTSVSKALSSLAVPFLLSEHKWPSIDAPIGGAIGWPSDDARTPITLRHVLSHTTGLEVPDYRSWIEVAARDHRADLQSALAIDPPGTVFEYSNRAVELTSEVVAEAAGMPLDDYLRPRLLEPLGIDATWARDKKGHARVHAGVRINAVDLAKVGVMMRDGGAWAGQQVLPVGWVDTATNQPATAASPQVGLGWFLVKGRRGFQHTGDSGAFLLVLRDTGIVAAGVHTSGGRLGGVMREVQGLGKPVQ